MDGVSDRDLCEMVLRYRLEQHDLDRERFMFGDDRDQLSPSQQIEFDEATEQIIQRQRVLDERTRVMHADPGDRAYWLANRWDEQLEQQVAKAIIEAGIREDVLAGKGSLVTGANEIQRYMDFQALGIFDENAVAGEQSIVNAIIGMGIEWSEENVLRWLA